MKRLDILCNEMGDLRIKLSENAQRSLSGQTVVFTTEAFNLGTDESIIRNSVLTTEKKLQILNAKDSIRTKRSAIKQLKKEAGRLFDRRASEENLFEDCTKAEHSVLDANIMSTVKERAYRMFFLNTVITEMEDDRPKSIQYVLYSIECTKTGRSNRKTVAIANVNRNYVQISDFVALKDNELEKAFQLLTILFNKYNALKKECENWTEIASDIKDELKQYENNDFNTVMYWIENNL